MRWTNQLLYWIKRNTLSAFASSTGDGRTANWIIYYILAEFQTFVKFSYGGVQWKPLTLSRSLSSLTLVRYVYLFVCFSREQLKLGRRRRILHWICLNYGFHLINFRTYIMPRFLFPNSALQCSRVQNLFMTFLVQNTKNKLCFYLLT